MAKRTVFFVSDRTGITVQMLGHSLLTQFPEVEVEQVSIPFVDTTEKMQEVARQVRAAAQSDAAAPLVFATSVDPELAVLLERAGGRVLDFFGSFIPALEREFSAVSSHAPGRAHGMGDFVNYSGRVDAVNFALSHDDGVGLESLDKADVVLLGVSRSGKAPTALYLALLFGVRAANYPLTEESFDSAGLPASLQLRKRKLFGLTIEPQRLHQIRSERRRDSHYSSLKQCRFEVHWAESLFRTENIPFLDATVRSIEEIAVAIINRMGLKHRVF